MAYYTVLVEVLVHKIEYKENSYVRKDFVLLPKAIATQFAKSKAVRILSRDEQLLKEREWERADNQT